VALWFDARKQCVLQSDTNVGTGHSRVGGNAADGRGFQFAALPVERPAASISRRPN